MEKNLDPPTTICAVTIEVPAQGPTPAGNSTVTAPAPLAAGKIEASVIEANCIGEPSNQITKSSTVLLKRGRPQSRSPTPSTETGIDYTPSVGAWPSLLPGLQMAPWSPQAGRRGRRFSHGLPTPPPKSKAVRAALPRMDNFSLVG
jgi:hypothetical protein